MNCVNDFVATEPFPETGIQARTRSGFATAEQNVEVKGLKVLFGNETYPTGAIVFVEGEQFAAAWAKRRFRTGNTEFILVPVGMIRLFDLFPAVEGIDE